MRERFFQSTAIHRIDPTIGDVTMRYESVKMVDGADPAIPFHVKGLMDPNDLLIDGVLIDPDGAYDHPCLVARKIGDRTLLLPFSFLNLDISQGGHITPELAQKLRSLQDTAIDRLCLGSLAEVSKRLYPTMNALAR